MILTDKIYYADKNLLSFIKEKFDLIDNAAWYELYRHKDDQSLWRLSKWDKYQEQYFTRLNTVDNWSEFDDTQLRIQLLKQSRGITNETCAWSNCTNKALNGMAFCEIHAYENMNVRR